LHSHGAALSPKIIGKLILKKRGERANYFPGNKKKIVFLLSIFLAVGEGILHYVAKLNNCWYRLDKQIKTLDSYYFGIKTAIYIIKDVNTLCGPCMKYDRLKDDFVRIPFLVDQDYSDNDIENFRNAFEILPHHEIRRMNALWENVYKICNSNNRGFIYNFLVIIDNKGKIEEIRRF
jgi:hypothetical protein